MTIDNLIAGILILRPYYDTDGHHVGAEHDQIYLYKTDKPLSTEDVLKMRALGWFQESDEEDEETGEARLGSYDPNESWSHHT